MSTPNYATVTWDQLHRDARTLAAALMPLGPWHGIVAVSRGGLIPAAIVAFIGLAYIALEFVPSIEPPANMRYAILDSTCNKTGLEYTLTDHRDADAGWGAEQV